MASSISRPLSRCVQGRSFAALAQAESKLSSDEREPRAYVKKLKNGMLVGAIETQSPVARLAVVVNAGARYENGQDLGVAHCLRHATKLRTQNMTNLGITRAAQQIGSDVLCQATREYLLYRGTVTRNCAAKVVEILQELTTRQTITEWQLDDVQNYRDNLKLDLAILKSNPEVRLYELLHAAGFRDTLGRSLYAPEFLIGKYTPGQLANYITTYFTTGRLALVGVGIDNEELEELAGHFEPNASSGVQTPGAVFHGGEIRENVGGQLTFAAFAYSGPSQTSKDLLPAEVLKHVLGVGPYVKHSSGSLFSLLPKSVAGATSAPFGISAIQASYSDAGLFGFSVVAPNSQIEKVVKTSANQFRQALTAGVSEQDVQRAKTKLKAEIAMVYENPENLLSWLAEQTLNSDKIVTPQEVYKLVDPITTADVNNVAKKIAATRPAFAVTGNTNNVPYLDKLFS